MPSPAPPMFLAIMIISVVLIVWWRAALVLLAAFLVAVLITGMHEVSNHIDLQSARQTELLSPVGQPGEVFGTAPFPGAHRLPGAGQNMEPTTT